jgi:hypothetical protein
VVGAVDGYHRFVSANAVGKGEFNIFIVTNLQPFQGGNALPDKSVVL